MAFLHAIGLGIAIIVLRVLAPEIWNAVEHLALSMLAVASELMNHLQTAAATLSLPPTS